MADFVRRARRYVAVLLGLFLIAGCAEVYRKNYDALYGPSRPHDRRLTEQAYLAQLSGGRVSYVREVQPILDSRCIVCHGCYDAPCQLKLEAFEGLERGGSKTTVYDGTRLHSIAPTRLFIDADGVEAWRSKGFFPALNERRDSAEANLGNSLLFRMLQQKQDHPLPNAAVLPDSFDFGLDRPLSCPTIEEFDGFAAEHPEWGMPYGFPGLSQREHNILVGWLRQGAVAPPPYPVSPQAAAAVERWEAFLNGGTLKERLFARYVYEHLFIGDLHFRGLAPREFFRLVRSKTPPGQPIRETTSIRPFDDPGPGAFYYRLKPMRQTIVDKNHMVYELDDARMRRYRELFLEPEYPVTELPGYAIAEAANPFKTFVAIPPTARYRFMLDDAYFFISGFMKGPVCRGQVALNVIQDRFWIAFAHPETDPISGDARFLASQEERLRLPTEKENDPGLADIWYTYWRLQQDYQAAKAGWTRIRSDGRGFGLEALWDGEGRNRDALLTAFRHFDSASVERGLVGDTPLTAWVIDYPLLERIHYLLVAGFDVFGNVGHQLATRLYMDFMRMEAENNFLAFLPAAMRKAERASWYQGMSGGLNNFVQNPLWGLDRETGVAYRSGNPKKEFFEQLKTRLGAAAGEPDPFVGCQSASCGGAVGIAPAQLAVERKLRPLAFLRGHGVSLLPELSYLRIRPRNGKPEAGWTYSLVKNTALKNVSILFLEDLRREPGDDTLTLVRGIVGSYPNFFFDVDEAAVDAFVDGVLNPGSAGAPGASLADRFGVHRGNSDFWKISDWFNRQHMARNPVTGGWLDLSRYDNL